MSLEINYPDLKPLTAGASFAQVLSVLYHAHLLRYSTQAMLKDLGSWKIATKNKLQALVDLGYLVKNDDVFTSTPKTLELLTKNGYKSELLPQPAEGRGAEIYTQEAICKLIQGEFYRAVLYPNFDYLIPDCLLVESRSDSFRLTFVEVEQKKQGWSEYLETKRQNYERLAKDEIAYKYWLLKAPHLGLECPRIDDFCFCVLCITLEEFRREWRGWRFGL